MCGRYRRTTADEELAKRYHIPIPLQTDLPISWNIAPSQRVLAIRYNEETKQRSLDALWWGLIPSWAKDQKIASKKGRCLFPADSFFEWKSGGTVKQPYSIGMKDGEPFVFAGLWEGWKPP